MELSFERLDVRCVLSASGFVPYSMQVAATNTTQIVKVLAVSFDPTIPSQGNKHFWEVIPGWKNPKDLAFSYKAEMERVSGGAIKFELVEWRDINDIPILENGYDYSVEEYYKNAKNNWKGFQPEGISADWNFVKNTQNFAASINAGLVDEVWLFGEHFMQLFGESWMAGPNAFYINGPILNYPELNRPFVGLSFDCGRDLPEMMHNMAHRTESTLERFYGGWNMNDPKTNWDKFAAVSSQTINGIGGVGNCHFPVNGTSHYDYSNSSIVLSTADDWINYPNLTSKTTRISRNAWSDVNSDPDYHKDYLSWWFGHLPRASGKFADGMQNNWWKYLYDYNNYYSNGLEKPFVQNAYSSNVSSYGGKNFAFTVSFSSAYDIVRNTIGNGDVVVVGPRGYSQSAILLSVSDSRNGHYLVATFSINAPDGFWDAADNGNYSINIVSGSVSDVAGRSPYQAAIGSFGVNIRNTTEPNFFIPKILSVVPSNKSVSLSWSKSIPRNPNLPILGYKISYSMDGKIWKILPQTYISNSATVGGLSNGRGYYFKIGVVTKLGVGDWSLSSARVFPNLIIISPLVAPK